MNFDLIDYANAKRKIPQKLLNQHLEDKKKQIGVLKILASHFIDFWTIIEATLITQVILTQVMFKLLRSDSALLLFEKVDPIPGMFFSFCSLYLCYYFTCYYFNQGQTLGMRATKMRVHLERKSFKSTLVWTLYSTLVFVTFGLSSKWLKEKLDSANLGTIESEDHLYVELMVYRDLPSMDLLAKTHTVDDHHEKIYEKIAA